MLRREDMMVMVGVQLINRSNEGNDSAECRQRKVVLYLGDGICIFINVEKLRCEELMRCMKIRGSSAIVAVQFLLPADGLS